MIWATTLAILTVVVLVLRVVHARRTRDAPGNETVAVAFAPPRALTPGLAVRLRRDASDRALVPAAILDLAVRGVWQVGVRHEEGSEDGARREGGTRGRGGTGGRDGKQWFVQRASTETPALDDVQRAVYRAVFPRWDASLVRDLTPDRERALAFADAVDEAGRQVVKRGWVAVQTRPWARALALAGPLVGGAAAATMLSSLSVQTAPLLGFALLGGLASGLVRPRPWWLTVEGRRLSDELDGLKLYMTMAEADRMKVLQSPDTALRLPAGPDAAGEIAKLHERLLPYAVVFGILPQWTEVLSHDYAEADMAPDWLYLPMYDVSTLLVWSAFVDAGGLGALDSMGSFDTDPGAGFDAGADAGGAGELGGGFGDGGASGGDGGGFDFGDFGGFE